jgi:hypothetical protein
LLVDIVGGSARTYLAILALAGATLVVAQASERGRLPSLRGVPSMAVGAAACVVIGWPLLRTSGDERYEEASFTAPLGALVEWADGLEGEPRIALAGFFEQYPLFGADLANRVQIPSITSQRGVPRAASTCERWRTALRAGEYDYVVLLAQNHGETLAELAWTQTDPGAQAIEVPGTAATIFAFDAAITAPACSSPERPDRPTAGS